MRLSAVALTSILAALTSALPIDNSAYHDSKTAAQIARTLLHRESLTALATNTGDNVPVSFVEYYADCHDDGQPVMLMIDISSSNKNIENGSKASLSIKVGDHQLHDHVDPHYPGQVLSSTAGSPRVSLRGKFVPVDVSEDISLRECFSKRHHDSVFWFPGSKVHSSHWTKFEVEEVYFVGGFGDRAYIGEIPVEEYLNATLLNTEEYASLFHKQSSECEEEKSWAKGLVDYIWSFVGESDVTASEADEVEDPHKYWKHYGKEQRKHWKKFGKDQKKKWAGDDEDKSVEVASESDEVEDPHKYWKHYGKEQRKHWKKFGKDQKKKWAGDDEDKLVEVASDDEVAPAPGTPGDYWKNHGKEQKKHWKKVGKDQKRKWASVPTPGGDDDGQNILAIEALIGTPGDYWKNHGKEQKKYWKDHGKKERKHWKKVHAGEPESDEE
ncbi:transcription factor activity, RNA polymerase II transcription factor binding protein [[Candida] boidinii]|nr:transcription factor activity, RNA polymerase II transcription factor binding protein [[Candida] boidinii]